MPREITRICYTDAVVIKFHNTRITVKQLPINQTAIIFTRVYHPYELEFAKAKLTHVRGNVYSSKITLSEEGVEELTNALNQYVKFVQP